jgi:hypothetical protein
MSDLTKKDPAENCLRAMGRFWHEKFGYPNATSQVAQAIPESD